MDEIQMFKQMMKREEDKKKEAGSSPNLDSPAAGTVAWSELQFCLQLTRRYRCWTTSWSGWTESLYFYLPRDAYGECCYRVVSCRSSTRWRCATTYYYVDFDSLRRTTYVSRPSATRRLSFLLRSSVCYYTHRRGSTAADLSRICSRRQPHFSYPAIQSSCWPPTTITWCSPLVIQSLT